MSKLGVNYPVKYGFKKRQENKKGSLKVSQKIEMKHLVHLVREHPQTKNSTVHELKSSDLIFQI